MADKEVPLLDIAPKVMPFADEDTPPKRKSLPERGPKIAQNANANANAYKPGKLVAPLTEMYSFLGLGVMLYDADISTAILENAEQCAISLDKLAEKNPAIRKVLYALVETSAWGQVITAHLPIILAIAGKFMPAIKNFPAMFTNPDSDGGSVDAS